MTKVANLVLFRVYHQRFPVFFEDGPYELTIGVVHAIPPSDGRLAVRTEFVICKHWWSRNRPSMAVGA
jgi:hypothetical protein